MKKVMILAMALLIVAACTKTTEDKPLASSQLKDLSIDNTIDLQTAQGYFRAYYKNPLVLKEGVKAFAVSVEAIETINAILSEGAKEEEIVGFRLYLGLSN